jgi:hypothetical protein
MGVRGEFTWAHIMVSAMTARYSDERDNVSYRRVP